MKKIYIIPETTEVHVEYQQMLASSVTIDPLESIDPSTADAPDLDSYFDGGNNLDKFFE